jgi:Tol biopolymer transport system component
VAYVVVVVDSSQQFVRNGPFVRDLVTGETRAMPNPGLDGSWLFPDVGPSLSDDGSRVVYSLFDPSSSDLPAGFYRFQTLVADTATAAVITTVYESLIAADATSIPRIEPTISGDGTEVDLAKTVDGVATIFRDDLDAPGLHPILTDIPEPRGLALSDDGNLLGFLRSSQYVVSTNGSTPRVVSANRLGRAATATAGALSGNGQWVAFASNDPSLVRADRNGVEDVFLRSVWSSLRLKSLAPH